MKISAVIIVFFLLFNFKIHSQNSTNCFTIAVGKNVSETGSVFIGHNEDDGGDLIINLHKIPRIKHSESEYFLTSGHTIPQVEETYKLLWIETTQQYFGDFFMNEWGVTICSNACTSKEDTAKGYINYDLRKIIAERANSAREGVIIAGQLISKSGYSSSGRTYCISDAYEVWLLSIVQGKHWVAQRVPDDEVAIVPNYYTIGEIDLSDSANFLGSADIIDYAITRNWYNPESEKPFNFRQAYSSTLNLYALWNIPRHWIGLQLLSEKKYGFYDEFPFSFKPKHKISFSDIKNLLSNHFEGTDFELNTNIHTNPHKSTIHPICNASTKFSVIVELHNTYPENNQNIIWFAPLNPCINPYVPIMFAIDSFPAEYSNRNWNENISTHFDEKSNNYENNPKHAFSIFHTRNSFVDSDYWKQYHNAKKFKEHFEDYAQNLFSEKRKAETSYRILLELYGSEKNFKE